MKLLNFGLASVLSGLSVVASSMAAQALDFNFSFTTNKNQNGSNVGTVSGVIMGLNEGANTEFNIIVKSNQIGLESGTNLTSESGSFQVTDGFITGVENIFAHNSIGSETLSMNYYGVDQLDDGFGTYQFNQDLPDTLNHYNFSPATATAVPFDFNPTEGAALGIPLFIGLGLLRKKKLAQKSAAKKVAQLVS